MRDMDIRGMKESEIEGIWEGEKDKRVRGNIDINMRVCMSM